MKTDSCTLVQPLSIKPTTESGYVRQHDIIFPHRSVSIPGLDSLLTPDAARSPLSHLGEVSTGVRPVRVNVVLVDGLVVTRWVDGQVRVALDQLAQMVDAMDFWRRSVST